MLANELAKRRLRLVRVTQRGGAVPARPEVFETDTMFQAERPGVSLAVDLTLFAVGALAAVAALLAGPV